MYAITPNGVGNEVGARSVRDDWPLAEGETFTADWQPGMVLSEDGQSLRWPTDKEQAASDAADWLARIATERERRLNTSISVPLSDGDYTIPVSDRSAALAPAAARNARADGKTRPFPTDRGVVERGADDLDRIEGALDAYLTGVWRRVAELEKMVAEGSITEGEIETGWP